MDSILINCYALITRLSTQSWYMADPRSVTGLGSWCDHGVQQSSTTVASSPAHTTTALNASKCGDLFMRTRNTLSALSDVSMRGNVVCMYLR